MPLRVEQSETETPRDLEPVFRELRRCAQAHDYETEFDYEETDRGD